MTLSFTFIIVIFIFFFFSPFLINIKIEGKTAHLSFLEKLSCDVDFNLICKCTALFPLGDISLAITKWGHFKLQKHRIMIID
jgi:hypothetical protein